MKYRLYIDESGTHSYSNSNNIKQRYLSLTGIIISSEDYESDICPKLLEIKKVFTDDIDDLPILHREDIQNKEGVFSKLNDPSIQKQFDEKLLSLYENGNYTICTVVIDKKEHYSRYDQAAEHPYHYCLTVLLEKYVSYLKNKGKGDVVAEARGGNEDLALKKVYKHFYNNGTAFKSKQSIQESLTSNEIKIKPKEKGIDGLQLADLLSLPTKLYVLFRYKRHENLSDNFTLEIIKKIRTKYYRSAYNGKIMGYGIKLL